MPARSSTLPIRLALALALVAPLAACDAGPAESGTVLLATADMAPDVDTPPDAEVDADAEADAAPDAAPDCAPDCPVIAWSDGPPLTRVSDHHSTVILGGDDGASLYVLGGIETGPRGAPVSVSDEIVRSGLDADGTPAPFGLHGRLPFALAFHGQAVGPEVIHLVAGVRMGFSGRSASAAIVAVPHGPGDALGEPVTCDEALAGGIVHPTAERVGGRLYVIGGMAGNVPVADVWVAEVGPDGCPLPFAAAAPLPEPRSHHASAVIDGRIVVMGGFGPNQAARTDVLASTHGPDGAIDGWAVVGTLDPAPWTASAVVDGDWLWLVGGGEGSGFGAGFVDTVRRAPLVDGLPGAFEVVMSPLPIARSHVHQTPLFEGRIYSVGGRVFLDDGFSMTSTDRTFVGALLDR